VNRVAIASRELWTNCVRGHGDPDQSDPTIDANNVIQVTYPTGYNPQEPRRRQHD
jgi:hypothetical protein